MICAKNYEKLSKSVKIMVKILSVPFLFGHALYSKLILNLFKLFCVRYTR